MSLFDEEKREDIVRRINNLNAENKALWGKMNANQMLCHTTDQLRIALGDLKKAEAKAPFLGKTIMKWAVLYLIEIPKNVPTSPQVNPFLDGTKPTDFESDRQTLLDYIKRFCSQSEDFKWTPHFKFGEMTGQEWAILAYKHLNHHLKQFGV